MTEIILKIDGMRCPMCEAHINDAIRNNYSVKKVSSSHKKKETVILTELPLDDDSLTATVKALGFTVLSVEHRPYEKKGLFSRK